MANVKITDMSADAAITGVELFPVSDGGSPKKVTIDQVVAYTVDEIEAIAACATLDSGDSLMMLENDTVLKPVTYEVVEDAIAETMYAEADIGAIADTDVFLVKDNATTKGITTASALATYMLATLEPSILDISDKTAKATPVDADLLFVCDGTTPKKTTFAQMYAAILANFDTYLAALGHVASTNDTDVFYTTQTGTEKYATLLDIWEHFVVKIQALTGKTTPVSADILTIQDSEDSSALKEMTITNMMKALDIDGMTDIGAALADADLLIVDDGAGGTNRKTAMSRVWTYVATQIQGLDAKTTPVTSDILTIQDSADSNNLKELTILALQTLFDARYYGLDGTVNTLDNIAVYPGVGDVEIISSGAITVTNAGHHIDTEAGASSDDLDTINGLTLGFVYVFHAADTTHTVVFRHDTGNILCHGGKDIVLETSDDFVIGYSDDGSTIKCFGFSGDGGEPSELTISSGVIAVRRAWHTIDTQSDDATDDLDSITGGTAGEWYTFQAEDTSRSVVFKHGGAGNIVCEGGVDLTLDSDQDLIHAFCNGTHFLCQLINIS